MSADAAAPATVRSRLTRLELAAAALFALLTIQYFASSIALAASAPWWMDEVLAVWTARLESPRAIWTALVHGAEFSPPLYDLFLGGLHRLGASSTLALRLPSIVAGYAAALMIGAMAWRRGGVSAATVAAGLVLSSGLFGYAVQARPYALVTAVFAAALMCHDRAEGRPWSRRRAVLLALLLALAIGLHFYALLLAGALALIELTQALVARRRADRRALSAIAAAGASILLWWPILHAARVYSGGDVTAPDYYARPTFVALIDSYAVLLGVTGLPLLALVIVATLRRRRTAPADLVITASVLVAVPFIVFVFALLVSHSYADRYVIAGTLGFGLAGALQLRRLAPRTGIAAALLVLVALLTLNFVRNEGELAKDDRRDALTVAAAAPDDLPIATGSGLRFLEIAANAPPSIRRRLIFVDVPDPAPRDPTNRNQVMRWKAIDPALRVIDGPTFLCATPRFLLLTQPDGGGPDALPGWLTGRARFHPVVRHGAALTLVRARPCGRSST